MATETVNQKKHTEMFLSHRVHAENPADSDEILYVLSWTYLPQSNIKVFHLIWIMHRVKLKTCISMTILMLLKGNSNFLRI